MASLESIAIQLIFAYKTSFTQKTQQKARNWEKIGRNWWENYTSIWSPFSPG